MVITLQTPAQAGEVRALMRKARVVPLAATVTRIRAAAVDRGRARGAVAASAPAARAESAPAVAGTGRGAPAMSAAPRPPPLTRSPPARRPSRGDPPSPARRYRRGAASCHQSRGSGADELCGSLSGLSMLGKRPEPPEQAHTGDDGA